MRVVARLVVALSLLAFGAAARAEEPLDLSNAVVVVPAGMSGPPRKAVEMLVDEAHKRSNVRLTVVEAWPGDKRVPVIAVGPIAAFESFAGPLAKPTVNVDKAEGFTVRVEWPADQAGSVLVCGNDDRGVLFGVGYLLRKLEMTPRAIKLPAGLSETTQAPRFPIRGHQLGYRPKTNSYDAWDLPQWEQYIRDLAVFGCNAIELIPPRSDDDADSPHFPRPQIEMMEGMSRIADEYGIDVWVWYPALDDDYSKLETVEFALKEWAGVLGRLPRVDAIFVPTGDPGNSPPAPLFRLLKLQTEQLVKLHPGAETWISVQSFDASEWGELMKLLNHSPDWLTGVVYGPQTRVSLAELRKQLPKQYQIRRYPDITHSMRCEYPVPNWDLAYAFTEAREPINPRPLGQAEFFGQDVARDANHPALTSGFITYSEGCNDDVNKFVWSGLAWRDDLEVDETLQDYGRYFFQPSLAHDVAQGLLALEQNWNGPLPANPSVATTLKQWLDMDPSIWHELRANWRYQQALYRAYYDEYVRRRLIYETAIEGQAMDALARADKVGAEKAIKEAEAILRKAVDEPVAGELRARIVELADLLFNSIRMQLSVERHQAIDVGRGANLDTIDVPLNNQLWLEAQFAEIRKMGDEGDRRAAVHRILNWDDPGPGGYYDDLGNFLRQPHLVGLSEPSTQRNFFGPVLGFHRGPGWRTSWSTHIDGLYDGTVKMHYDDLDPASDYVVRIVYAGDNDEVRVRATTDNGWEVHPWMPKPVPVKPVEFTIPHEVVKFGELSLVFEAEPGRGGPGRGVQIGEIWLIKKRR